MFAVEPRVGDFVLEDAIVNADEPPVVARATREPHDWIRLQPVACRHVAASAMLIQVAAEGLPPQGRVIVLGPGDCRELPLGWLAQRCSSLTLVDRQPAGAEAVVAALRPQTSCAWEVRADDLIGVNDAFLAETDARLAAHPDADSAAQSLLELVGATQPDAYVDASGPYDLVVASCVFSQVANSLTQGLVARISERFPNDAARWNAAPAWTEALFALSERAELAFLRSVAGLTAPGGRVFLSETVQGCFIHPHPEGGWQTEGTYRMTRRPHVADYVPGRFSIVRQGAWPWVAMQPTPASAGRLFQVEGLVLAAP